MKKKGVSSFIISIRQSNERCFDFKTRLVLAVILAFNIFSQNTGNAQEYKIDSANLKRHVNILANDALKGRMTGSDGDAMAAYYIAGIFKESGLLAEGFDEFVSFPYDYWQAFHFYTPFGRKIESRNVVGIIRGTDSLLKNEHLLIGAHFDHIGTKNQDVADSVVELIYNGADDNASGVAILLELANYFSLNPTKRSLVFIAFSGEEYGFVGSTAYIEKHKRTLKKSTQAMFNLDMLGNLREQTFLVRGSGTSLESQEIIDECASETSLTIMCSPTAFNGSDHTVFYEKKIPVFSLSTFLSSTYHTPEDIPSSLNYSGMQDVADFIKNLIAKTADYHKKLKFSSVGNKPTSYDTYHTYLSGGKKTGIFITSDDFIDNGAYIEFVETASLAAIAGIKDGDIILKINDIKTNSPTKGKKILSRIEKDELVRITIQRKNEIITFTL